MSEHAIQNEIRNALAGHCICLRANVGSAWVGSSYEWQGRDLLVRNARKFSTGLPPGFSDLFGVARDGRFFALEVKTDTGRTSEQQGKFLAAVERNGGIAGVARSPDDALRILGLGA